MATWLIWKLVLCSVICHINQRLLITNFSRKLRERLPKRAMNMKSGSKKTQNCEKLGRQSNQTHTEDTNNSWRKEPALFISILHARKSCQLSLRQTAAAFHTILCTTSSGPPLYTEQGGCVLRLTVL